MSTRSNIVLIGMPGAGKSTVGVLLAKRLAMGFVDTDVTLQRTAGATLQQLIAREGPRQFLEREASHIAALNAENTVIATGGSVVYSERAMAHLEATGRVVYLEVPLPILQTRLENLDARGVVTLRPGQTLAEIADERLPLYETHAEFTVPCDASPPEVLVQRILAVCDRTLS